MKKFINKPENCEAEMISGLVKAYPSYVRKLDDVNVLVRAEKKNDRVALITGGGSGHEPAHAGYIGKGMLDCAVPGAVFSSPTPDQIYEGIKAVATPAGVLMIIKNYSGDIMNFEMAQDLAEMDGIQVAKVITNDDVAVQNSTWTIGRRGVAGTVFVHKIAGAMAEDGATLEEVRRVAQETIDNVRTMGVAISPCIVPAAGIPGFTIAEDELEMGIGIHGEPGVSTQKMKPVDTIIDELLEHILADLDYSDSEVAVMVNSSGATPQMELLIAYNHIADVLADKGIKVYRSYVGEYMTSLEMQGMSVSLLRLNDERKKLLDSFADTPAFKEMGR